MHRSITLRLGTERGDEALREGSTSLSRAFLRSVHSFSRGSPPAQADLRRGDEASSSSEAGALGEGREAGAEDVALAVGEETTAAAAERHRLSAATGVDLQVAVLVFLSLACVQVVMQELSAHVLI